MLPVFYMPRIQVLHLVEAADVVHPGQGGCHTVLDGIQKGSNCAGLGEFVDCPVR